MPRSVHVTCAALLCFATLGAAQAQVPPTNDVAGCSLLTDPSAQRSCLESARHKRSATAFDPSAVRLRGAERRARAEGIVGVRRALGAKKRGAAAPAVPTADAPTEMP